MGTIIDYNNKKYKIYKIIKGIEYDYVIADFLYKNKWIEVKCLQILIDIARFIKKEKLNEKL